jgi:hypothetical protein
MFMLNLLFEFGQTNGRFRGDRGSSALTTSMNWLKLTSAEPVDPNVPAFNPETADWENLGEAGTLLIPGRPAVNDNICIRIRQDPQELTQIPATATLQLAIGFGRSVRATQVHSSPFVDTQAPPAHKTTLIFDALTRNSGPAWYFPLGQIAIRPTHPNLTHRYEFSVGVIVKSDGVTRYYGEDPEMDIGL